MSDEAGLTTEFDAEQLRVLNAELIQKVDDRTESLALLELVQETAPVGFGFMDREFRFLRLNETLAAINGRPLEEQLGRTVAEIVPEIWPEIEPMYRHVLDTGEPVIDHEMEGEVPSAPGEVRHWRVSYYPVGKGDRPIGIGVVVVDVTDLKRALSHALEASRLKSEFMSNMSHEIRTPLNGIVGMTELLRGSSLGPEEREYVDGLAASNKALLAIVGDILDYSKLETRQLTIELADFELHEAVADACGAFEQQAHAQGVELSHHVGADVPTIVTGDRPRLLQALSKLLANAVKFTSSGEIVVRVMPDRDETLRFEVSDDGIGIDDAASAHLFDAFVQADGSTTRHYGGIGIGLTIARELVELMRGQIGARSRGDSGSVFWFTAELPALTDTPDKRASDLGQPAVAADGTPINAHGSLVLIVEDDAINSSVAEVILGKRGLRTHVARNGSEAVKMAAANTYAAIFMDCQLPEMDGYEATRYIREAEVAHHAPIIAMTANAMRGDRERCLASGMDDYLSKPVEPQAFSAAVDRWVPPNGSSEMDAQNGREPAIVADGASAR